MSSATVTALALQGIEKYYGREGVDVVMVSQKYAFPEGLWSNLEQDVLLKEFVAFFEDLGSQSTAPEILWQAGFSYDISQLGCLGRLIDKSPTLGDALLALRDFFSLVQSDAHIQIHIEEGLTTLTYKILDMSIWPRRCDAEFTLGIFQSIIQRYVPDQCYLLHIGLEDYSETSHLLAKALHSPCRMGGDFNQISFPTALLECRRQTVPTSDSHDVDCLSKELQTQLSEKNRQIPVHDRVRCSILKNIGSQSVSQSLIARELGMSRRTLRRKLADEKYAYQQVLDNCRMLTAAIDLQYSRMTVADIALKLGLSEQSALIRSFTKWYGQTPNEYRRHIQESHSLRENPR